MNKVLASIGDKHARNRRHDRSIPQVGRESKHRHGKARGLNNVYPVRSRILKPDQWSGIAQNGHHCGVCKSTRRSRPLTYSPARFTAQRNAKSPSICAGSPNRLPSGPTLPPLMSESPRAWAVNK